MAQNVLVIGAGVSGLTSAICLLEAGYGVTVLAEKRFIREVRIEAGPKHMNIRPRLRLGQTGSPLITLTVGAAQQG